MIKPCYGPMIGVELYTIEKKQKSFNFLKMSNIEILKKFLQTNIYKGLKFIIDPAESFKNQGFADSWKGGEKSN